MGYAVGLLKEPIREFSFSVSLFFEFCQIFLFSFYFF